MKRIVLTALTIMVLSPSVLAADDAERAAAAKAHKVVSNSTTRTINNQTSVACNICFTCGGDWPVFAGSIRSVGDTPRERGSSCSGDIISRSDSSPFLCCR